MTLRQHTLELEEWLTKKAHLSDIKITPMAGDASFRCYFRVSSRQGSYVVMDASQEKASCVPFVAIAEALYAEGLKTPRIIAKEMTQGYLLLSDFGNEVYLHALNPSNVDVLYGRALHALSILQACRTVKNWTIPFFTASFMRQELTLFKEWFLQTYLGLTLSAADEKMLATSFYLLASAAADQPIVFMHRDYHSANLMVLPENQVGILDFQDAFYGPVTYDAVSLLRDCYIAWPESQVIQWALQYREAIALTLSKEEFLYRFDMMGLQRHLKALLTFSRKKCRDHQSHYLQHIPRTLQYIMTVSERYPDYQALHLFLKRIIAEHTLCAE
jgi:aminoglycoside/choline kinase family phosphotransferase